MIGDDIEKSVKWGLDRAKRILEICGCLVVRGKYIGTCGKLPELIGVGSESRDISSTLGQYRG